MRCGTVHKLLELVFASYGAFVARNPWPFVLVPLAFSGFCFYLLLQPGGFGKMDNEFDDRPYKGPNLRKLNPEMSQAVKISEKNALWAQAHEEHLRVRLTTDSCRWVSVIARDKHDHSLLNVELMQELQRLNTYILHEIGYNSTGDFLNYQVLCNKFGNECYENRVLSLVDSLLQQNSTDLAYPSLYYAKSMAPLYIGDILGGVDTNHSNSSEPIFVKSWRLLYYLDQKNEQAIKWQDAFANTIDSFLTNSSLEVSYLFDRSMEDGFGEIRDTLVPFFGVSFALLSVFVFFGGFKFTTAPVKLNWVESKPFLAFGGCVSCTLAIICAQAILVAFGRPCNALVAIMPFLVISTGVNDMFVLLGAWHETDRSQSVEKRMSLTMAEAAVPITITSLTNCISFAIGVTNGIRGIRTLCLFTSLAMGLDYLFQVIFFAGMMVLSGQYEAALVKRSKLQKTVSQSELLSSISSDSLFVRRQMYNEPTVQNSDEAASDYYSKFLNNLWVQIATLLFFAFYLTCAVFGCSTLQEGLLPQNLLMRKFHATKFFDWMEDDYWPRGLQLDVIVQNAPQLSFTWERKQLEQLVKELESAKYSAERGTTEFWYSSYREFSCPKNICPTDLLRWTDKLYDWAHNLNEYKLFGADLFWRNLTDEDEKACQCNHMLQAFRFRIAMKNLDQTNHEGDIREEYNDIASRYPSYDIGFIYPSEKLFLDDTDWRGVAISLAVTTISMISIIAIFVPNLFCLLWITLSIISINLGVFGFLTFWGGNLDAIALTSIAMSIGFSEDFTVHVAHSFHAGHGGAKEVEAIERLGLPVLQAALSTLLGVLAILAVDSYVVVTFVKTVFLVIALGLAHAFLFLPVLSNIVGRLTNRKVMLSANKGQPTYCKCTRFGDCSSNSTCSCAEKGEACKELCGCVRRRCTNQIERAETPIALPSIA